jgi:hypothetical protein
MKAGKTPARRLKNELNFQIPQRCQGNQQKKNVEARESSFTGKSKVVLEHVS